MKIFLEFYSITNENSFNMWSVMWPFDKRILHILLKGFQSKSFIKLFDSFRLKRNLIKGQKKRVEFSQIFSMKNFLLFRKFAAVCQCNNVVTLKFHASIISTPCYKFPLHRLWIRGCSKIKSGRVGLVKRKKITQRSFACPLTRENLN